MVIEPLSHDLKGQISFAGAGHPTQSPLLSNALIYSSGSETKKPIEISQNTNYLYIFYS